MDLLHLLIHNECNTNQPKHSHFVRYKLTVANKSFGEASKIASFLFSTRFCCHLPRQHELILQSVYDTFVWPAKSLRPKLGTQPNTCLQGWISKDKIKVKSAPNTKPYQTNYTAIANNCNQILLLLCPETIWLVIVNNKPCLEFILILPTI